MGLISVRVPCFVRTPNLKQLVLPRTCDFSREAEHMAMKSSLKENPVEALIESTPKLKMFIIQSTVVSMKALISLLISLENLEAVNIVHSIIMDMALLIMQRKNILYVAETENHVLREIDFVNEKVRALAGNRTKGSDYVGGGKGDSQFGNQDGICSEIKKLDPTSKRVSTIAGTGKAGSKDGTTVKAQDGLSTKSNTRAQLSLFIL
ncbi:hypothetical protein JHK87_042984 [Glycine soja]|nr:hypothetical protein JHK87_042984 [Glycine soja]